MPRFASVAVNIAQINELFDYEIPEMLDGVLQPGVLVIVKFGRLTVQGVVVKLKDQPSVTETKLIQSVVDAEVVLNDWQLRLAHEMSRENLATLPQCLELMVPAGLSQRTDVLLKLGAVDSTVELTPSQQRLIELLKKRGALRGQQVSAALPRIPWRESLPGLEKRRLIKSTSVLQPPSVRPRVIRTALFSAQAGWEGNPEIVTGRANSAAAERRNAALKFLEEQAIPVPVSWVYAQSGASSSDLSALAAKGLIIFGETEIWRDPLENLKPVLTQPPLLTPDQDAAWRAIHHQLTSETQTKPILLEGVTGSGKTELYLRAAAQMLEDGKGVFILVPEISLTPQTVKRFFARFAGKVGLVHSKLSEGERYDTWRRIRAGMISIVVGPRSALFSPLTNPGLIIIDEAHDDSYHQDEKLPHYHAVRTAYALSRVTGAQLLLGSATPGVELQHQFHENGWQVLRLPKRVLAHADNANRLAENEPAQYLEMPPIDVVDMRRELRAGNRSPFSRELHASLAAVLARQEQAILFLNRRGSASYVFCRECGYVMRCPRCDTQLTWHADSTALICHTCGYQRGLPDKCPACSSRSIRRFGMGTESLEAHVNEAFPNARVLRWDADTTRYRGAHDIILDHFVQHRADILIGTQMVAKSLDLPLVTLVGVVLADLSLNLPDFRAAERTYQLLTQVAGRAGRSGRGGKVIFQTYQPDNYAIQAAAAYDSEGFYKTELEIRQRMGYPPFSLLLKIEFRHTNAQAAQQAAITAGEQIKERIERGRFRNTFMIGPVPCFYQKRAGYYRWQVIIRGPDPALVLASPPSLNWQSPGLAVDTILDPLTLL